MVMDGKGDLFQMVLALHSLGGSPGCLNGRQKQADEQTNDRNDDEQFHQRKTEDSV
jgi:hypothetical protein